MQNRFGLKDAFLACLIIAVIVMCGLMMIQSDRRYTQSRQLISEVSREANAAEQQQRLLDTLSRAVASLAETEKSQGDLIDAALKSQADVLNRQAEAITTLAAELATLRATGVRVPGQGDAAASNLGNLGAESGGLAAATRDTSWARPGVEVEWFPAPRYVSDPAKVPGFHDGGTFTELFEAQLSTITAYRYADVYGRRIQDVVCDSLGRYDPVTLELEGSLAEAWQYDPNGMWLRAKLRENAVFSDGVPLTAEDLRWTFHEYIWNPEIEADRFRSTLDNIERVEVLAPHIVEFTFKEPQFLNLEAAATIHILPKHFYSRFTPVQINQGTGLMMGSGPFKLVSLDPDNQWTPGNTIALRRNELYWGARSPLAERRYDVVTDSLTRLTQYLNGLGDMMRPIPEQFDLKTRESEFNARHQALNWTNMRSGYSFIAWQCGKRAGRDLTPMHDKRVRRALTLLIDRDRINQEIYRGLAHVASGTNPHTSATYNPDVTPWPADRAAALALLAEAGWMDRDANGKLENEQGKEFSFEFTYSQGSEGTTRMVTMIKDWCAEVGIECVLKPIDWSVLQDILNRRDFDAVTFAWSASVPESDPNQIWHSSQIDNQGDNWIQYNNPDIDAVIDTIRATIDRDARMKEWHKFHAILHEDQPYTFLLELPWLRFVNRHVGNVHTYNTGLEIEEFFVSPQMLPAQP